MISLIVAMANGRVMGRNNQLPWHLSEDLKYFKRVTMGHSIIMGRKTFESIGKALPGRKNIIISRNPAYPVAADCWLAHSLAEAIELATGGEAEIFVTGGAEIFAAALPFAQKLYITRIYADIPGDTYFPEFDIAEWRETFSEKRSHLTEGLDYAFLHYLRMASN